LLALASVHFLEKVMWQSCGFILQELQQAEQAPSKFGDQQWRRSFVQALNAVAMKDAPRSSSSSGRVRAAAGPGAEGLEEDTASQACSDISRYAFKSVRAGREAGCRHIVILKPTHKQVGLGFCEFGLRVEVPVQRSVPCVVAVALVLCHQPCISRFLLHAGECWVWCSAFLTSVTEDRDL
jgi:hypothetical protein